MYEKISIIILNWNGWKDTIECLESLYRINYSNYEVILVDNFSTDDSIQKIKDWTKGKIEVESKYFEKTKCTHDLTIFEYTKKELENGNYLKGKKEIDKLSSNKKLFLLKNDKNYGFAGGNNVAIRQVIKEGNSEYILFLNNDIFVDNNFLNFLIKDYKKNKNTGMIAPINFNYFNGSIDFYGGNINWFLGKPYHLRTQNSIKNFEFLTGACLLIKTDTMKKIGGFDEKYFCYFEDADLCQKVIKNGYVLTISKKSKIFHKISASSGNKSEFKIYRLARNRLIFNKKFNGGINFFIFYIRHILIKSLISFVYFNKKQRKAWFKGLKDGIKN